MKKTGTIKKGHNCLTISLNGEQRFVKIFNSKGELLRHNQTTGAPEIQHMAAPGKYEVETDGRISTIISTKIELTPENDPTGLFEI